MQNSLVSIIIPMYNRADLIGETINSIISQDYNNWECIVVDDGSTQNNVEIVQEFSKIDNRIKLLERKNYNSTKGANACRNIGLQNAKGDFVIFFDSDDLMLPNHIKTKLDTISENDCDIAIFTSEYFNNPQNINPINYRGLFELDITQENYITQKINWITFDAIIKTSVAKKVNFNESLQANQEYNYFSKLLYFVKKAKAQKTILTKRRFDERSIQGSLSKNNNYNDKAFFSFFETYRETYLVASEKSKKFLINKISETAYRNPILLQNKKIFLFKEIISNYGILKGLNKIRILELSKK